MPWPDFAPDVLATAEAGDEVAAAIVDAAADELAALVQIGIDVAAPRAMAVRGADAVPVALGGRLLAHGGLRRRLEATVARRVPAAVTRDADGPPLVGALLLGTSRDGARYGRLIHVWTAPVRVEA